MDIYTKPDSVIIFLDENGYDLERENAKKEGLIKDNEYIVEYIDVCNWTSYVRLKGFKNYYNTVMFKRNNNVY